MELMREKYWAMYNQLVMNRYYYWHYRNRAYKIDRIIKCCLGVVGAGSIASWTIWNRAPYVWAVIVGLTQILAAIQQFLPFSERVIKVNYYLPELVNLLYEIDSDFARIDLMDYDSINDLIANYEIRANALESKFIGSTYFPRSKRCTKRAETDQKNYFLQRF
jgi:hypothetical protein